MKNPQLILASTSQYRIKLLSQLGWEFQSLSPDFDEAPFKTQEFAPEVLARLLAEGKARSLKKSQPNAFIIGADQVCALEGKIFSKPGNHENALHQLQELQGRTHELLTAVCLITPAGKTKHILNRTQLSMRKLHEDEIRRYLEADGPYDCGGSYKLEAAGIRLFENISMSDHTSIIGLPLIELCTLLLEEGFKL
jgi:septum formation protein